MKPRTVFVTLEIESSETLKEIRENFREGMKDTPGLQQVHVQVAQAPKARK